MSALIHRRKTGSGQWIDAAQVEAGAFTMGPLFLDALLNDRDARPLGNRSPWVAPQGVYRCAGEDQWCAISVETDEQWRGLRLALGNPEWARSPGLQTLAGRLVCHDEIDRHIEEWTRLRDKYDVMEVLQRHGIPTGAVQGVEDQICKDPQYKARGFFASIQEPEMGELLSENLPVQLLETPGCYQTPAPLMGQHTDEICVTLLGMNQRRILELQSEKVLY
jgi:benzylsuccinate CoA-transferase BbsF subunit